MDRVDWHILEELQADARLSFNELYRVTGQGCSVLMVAVPTMPDFEELIDRLGRYGRPSSSMVLADLLPWKPVDPA